MCPHPVKKRQHRERTASVIEQQPCTTLWNKPTQQRDDEQPCRHLPQPPSRPQGRGDKPWANNATCPCGALWSTKEPLLTTTIKPQQKAPTSDSLARYNAAPQAASKGAKQDQMQQQHPLAALPAVHTAQTAPASTAQAPQFQAGGPAAWMSPAQHHQPPPPPRPPPHLTGWRPPQGRATGAGQTCSPGCHSCCRCMRQCNAVSSITSNAQCKQRSRCSMHCAEN